MSCNPSWHSAVLREVLRRSVTRELADQLRIWPRSRLRRVRFDFYLSERQSVPWRSLVVLAVSVGAGRSLRGRDESPQASRDAEHEYARRAIKHAFGIEALWETIAKDPWRAREAHADG